MISQLFLISISAILIENFVLVKFLGICSFLGVSKKTDTAFGMSMAVIFVMTLSSIVTWIVYHYLLLPLKLDYMRTVAFILVIAAIVQFIELFLKKALPALYNALGIYLPLITTNCAILGVTIINIDKSYNFIQALVYGISAGIGYSLAIILFSGIRERLELCDVPKPFEGWPIALIAAALMSMAFMGFQGLKLPF